MKKSKFLSLGANDFVKGLLIAVLTSILTVVYQMFNNCSDLFGCLDFKVIISTGVTSMLAYLLKNFTQNENGEILKK